MITNLLISDSEVIYIRNVDMSYLIPSQVVTQKTESLTNNELYIVILN